MDVGQYVMVRGNRESSFDGSLHVLNGMLTIAQLPDHRRCGIEHVHGLGARIVEQYLVASLGDQEVLTLPGPGGHDVMRET